LLCEVAAEVLSAKAGARTPDEVPAPAPAAPATDNMDVDAPPAAETPAAAPAADEEGSDAVGAVGVPAAATAPAPAPAAATLAALVVQVAEASAANSLFSELLLKVAQVVRLVEGERVGTFSDAEWIVATSLDGYFRKGMLPLKAGSSLRLFLATLLNRAPKAISTKFQYEEMELGQQTFEPQDVDLTKAVRTFQDQVEAFVASQRDRPYHGVSRFRRTNQWEARVTVPTEHRKGSDERERVFLGYFPTEKAAACAVFAFVEDDYRFDDEYVSKHSNRMISKEDFATMNEEMKAAADVGRRAAEEAPGRLRHRPAAAPGAVAKPQARKRRRSPPPGPARANETERLAAREPPQALAPVPTTTPAPPVSADSPAEPAGAVVRQLGVDTVRPSANCAVAQLLLRVAEATRSQGSRKEKEWTNIESDLAEALFAQFEHGALPLEARASLRSFLGQVLNCGTGRITDQFQRRVKKKQFEPRDGFDLDDVARRLEPLVEPFIKSLQARSRPASRSASRSSSPRAVPAPAPPPPPLLPAGVPQPPANAVQPVAAPAPAAEEGNEMMDVTE
jgi:hypothetical protein